MLGSLPLTALQERDRAMSWMLSAIFDRPGLGSHTLLRGGAALRKTWGFAHRFSENLTFTTLGRLPLREVQEAAHAINDTLASQGYEDAGPPRLEIQNETRGRETTVMRVPFTNPRLDAPETVTLLFTVFETLYYPPSLQTIWHPYPDAKNLEAARVPTYDLREVAAEKVRQLTGGSTQARDILDLAALNNHGIKPTHVAASLPAKFTRHTQALDPNAAARLSTHRDDFLLDFGETAYLYTDPNLNTFNTAWTQALAFIGQALAP